MLGTQRSHKLGLRFAAAYKVRDLQAELDSDAAQETAEAMQMQRFLEDCLEQLHAYEHLTETSDIFLDGPSGCGKSSFFEAFLHYVWR